MSEYVYDSINHKRMEDIVRCRDCKHYEKSKWIICTDISDVCMFWADGKGVKVDPNGFCAWGARCSDSTCSMKLRDDLHGHAYQDTYECSECGGQITVDACIGESEPPNYCPSCGREIEQ